MSDFFSSNLKFLREKKGYSQSKLANLIGVNQTTIARWEDDNRVPTIDNAVDVAKVLHIELPDILGRDLRLENNDNSFSELDQVLFSKAKDLSDEDKRVILNVIESINKKIDEEQNN